MTNEAQGTAKDITITTSGEYSSGIVSTYGGILALKLLM
jgi:hypothetical protein